MPANARVVGASGGASNVIWTMPSGVNSARTKNGVWHSTTRSKSSGWSASSGGSGGTVSAYSTSIGRIRSRGASANPSTISASFGGS
jgi:hypothetical protein